MQLTTWRYFDFWLLGTVLVLIIFSIAMIDSAIAGNIELIEGNTLQRQIIFALIGFGVILISTFLDYRIWVAIGRVLYIILFLFLLYILVGGDEEFGAVRWVFGIQPSELAKITIIVVQADFFSRNKDRINQLSTVAKSGLITVGLVGLIILQPDLSTSITVLVIWFAILFGSGLHIQHIALIIAIGVVLPIVGFPLMEDYQKQRIVNFAFPDPDARFGEEYNVNQAQITVGAGGWLGEGYGQGSQVQLRFLKVRHTDFIYSAIAEEFGFIGTLIIMILLLFLIYRCLRAAMLAPDKFGSLICFGVATLIGFQSVVNIGMNLNLMPVTGLPLPFISQGGSSLLSLMLAIGLVESVVSRQKT